MELLSFSTYLDGIFLIIPDNAVLSFGISQDKSDILSSFLAIPLPILQKSVIGLLSHNTIFSWALS